VDLAEALGVPEPVATALVRRGHRTVESAREFLAADERHDPAEFDGIGDAVARIQAATSAGRLITVHGDYDVDGVTSTAILVAALRELGAECDWLIPGRIEDGYGITLATIERLAARGTGLLVSVDCGITSVAEVAAAKAKGIDVIVTDHHQPGPELPACPIVHPVVSGYPCPDLCAAGVAHKLAGALLGVERAERDLDLVALATVADMVPLQGENRSLVRRGLELARRSPRPGLRALMTVAGVAPERLDEGDCGFRLAPRINAAGRLYRADAAVELFLTSDDARAREIAVELDKANLDRRETEAEVLADANRRLAELGEAGDDAPVIVLWGEGWHPGVVGICASRMAERHLKPAILIALDESGRGKGSGRSVPGFDLLAGLRACEAELARYGGHRAAAGLEIEADRLEAFRDAFEAHAAVAIAAGPAVREEVVDAVVGGETLGHELASQLARLGPFGQGNPPVRLLVPAARVADVRPMGETGRHARFSLASGSARAGGVAFGVGGTLDRAAGAGPLDVSLALELNEWNGAVEPRVVLGAVYEPTASGPDGEWRCEEDEHETRAAAELGRAPGFPEVPVELGLVRERVDRRGGSSVATVAALVSTGEPVLVVCADGFWRRALVESAVHPGRFGGGGAAIVAARGSIVRGRAAAERLVEAGAGGVVLADWAALALEPELARAFPHVALADPAPHPRLEAAVAAAQTEGGGYLHLLPATRDLSVRALALMLPLRSELAQAYRAISEWAGEERILDPAGLRLALCGPGGAGRSAEACARTLRILAEMGVLRLRADDPEVALEVVSSVRSDLRASTSYLEQESAHEECLRFLTERKKPSSTPLPAAA